MMMMMMEIGKQEGQTCFDGVQINSGVVEMGAIKGAIFQRHKNGNL